jgi:3'-phosphoadenosine 5'-phosphosulfate (PAPS) 3'-phosphatase
MHRDDLAFAFGEICLRAAVPVMDVYSSDFAAEWKADCSPVTEADRQAEAVILEALSTLLPDTPVIAEESFDASAPPSVGTEFLLVDPVDGTKEFVAKRGEFTVNIALVRDRRPVAGAVYAPALSPHHARRPFLGLVAGCRSPVKFLISPNPPASLPSCRGLWDRAGCRLPAGRRRRPR